MEKTENVTDDEIIQLQKIKKVERSQCIQDKIKFQIEEITKTKNLIMKFQEILADQKNMLVKLKDELKTVLTDDEINKLNYVDHDGLEDGTEDSTMPEDTDLRIVHPHTTGNKNRKRKIPQEHMENEIQDEIFDKSSLDSWSSHMNLQPDKDEHKRCEERIKIWKAAYLRLSRLLQETKDEVIQVRQENADLRLRNPSSVEEDRSMVPRATYTEVVRQLEDVRVQHAVCLRTAILRDKHKYSIVYAPISVGASNPPITEAGPSSSSEPVSLKQPQTKKNRKRRERLQKQKLIWGKYLQSFVSIHPPEVPLNRIDVSKLIKDSLDKGI